jgi:hypothetical protein
MRRQRRSVKDIPGIAVRVIEYGVAADTGNGEDVAHGGRGQ